MLNRTQKIALKIWICIICCAIIFSTAEPFSVAAAPLFQGNTPLPNDNPPVVEPELQAQFNADENIGYIIHFSERPNLDLAASLDWDVRGRFVVSMLQNTATKTQQRVRFYLETRAVPYQSFWVDNIILVNASDQITFNGLLAFTEIDSLRARRHPTLHEPVASEPAQPSSLLSIEPNLHQINADQVWGLGYDGSGIVVANIDTGVRYTHETLINQYRGNLGDGVFDHNYNWWDPVLGGSQSVPNDFHGHGSHTMGTILGDDGKGNQIGVAPGASWMACQAFEGGDSELLECGQFLLAPWDLNGQNPDPSFRPHIINNSWGDCLQYTDTWYVGMITSWLAAGIYPVFSNGNNTFCRYPSPPGLNTVSNPGRYGNVTSVGSTGKNDGLYAPHSNWGPTDNPDLLNPNGNPNLKPQVVAPGVHIRSASNGSNADYDLLTGTSMSAPHVSGVIALMWGSASCLIGNYPATETILETTANPVPYDDGTGGGIHTPNYAAGWGEVDALRAVQAAVDYCGADFAIDAGPEIHHICTPADISVDVNVAQISGFVGDVTLGIGAHPDNLTFSYDLNPLIPPGSSVLTLSNTANVPAGSYEIEVSGTSGDLTHLDAIQLTLYHQAPASPQLIYPLNGAQSIPVNPTFQWHPLPDTLFYLLEIAADVDFTHILFSTELSETRYQLPAWLAHQSSYFWRLSAANTCGQSQPSVSGFTTRASALVLLVDDDDNQPDVSPVYRTTLDSLGVDYEVWDTNNSDREPTSSELSPYNTVIWFLGDEWQAPAGPGDAGESALITWLKKRKCLILNGQDYLWNHGLSPFVADVFGLESYQDDVAHTSISAAEGPFDGLGPYPLTYPFFNFSDNLTPTDKAQIAWVGNHGAAGIIKDNGVSKTSLMAFPFEAIALPSARQQVMLKLLDWCKADSFQLFLPWIQR